MLTQEQMWHKKNVIREKRGLNLDNAMSLKIKEGVVQYKCQHMHHKGFRNRACFLVTCDARVSPTSISGIVFMDCWTVRCSTTLFVASEIGLKGTVITLKIARVYSGFCGHFVEAFKRCSKYEYPNLCKVHSSIFFSFPFEGLLLGGKTAGTSLERELLYMMTQSVLILLLLTLLVSVFLWLWDWLFNTPNHGKSL